MATTALFAEILVIGVQTTLILAGLLIGLFGWPPSSVLAALKGWEPLGIVGALAVAYSVGVAIDRFADSLTRRWDKGLRCRKHLPEGKYAEVRLKVMHHGAEPLIRFLEYARSRRRVARASALNGAVAAVVAAALIIRHSDQWVPLLVVVVVLSVFAGFSAWAWCRIGRMYYKRLHQAHEISVPRQKHTDNSADS